MRIFSAALFVMWSSTALAGAHPPEIEQRLAFFIGDWTIEGVESTYSEKCEWFADRSFVMCNTEDRESGRPVRGAIILGWSAADQNYTYHHFNEEGVSRSEDCFANDLGGLTCLAKRREGTKFLESRSHTWPVEGGIEYLAEDSENGGAWTKTIRLKYLRRG